MASLFGLALASIFVHSILFVSIFDIYFTSPVDRGMILPMFAKGASRGRVETFMYDAEWEDFADSDASSQFLSSILKTCYLY